MEQKKKKRKKRKINRLEITLLCLAAICFIYSIVPNYQKKEETSFSILYQNQEVTGQLKQKEKVEGKEVYLELADVQNLFQKEIYLEETGEWIVTLSETKVAAIHTKQPILEINSVQVQVESPVIDDEGTYYIPVSTLKDIYHLEIQYIQETKTLLIDSKEKELIHAETSKKLKVKEEEKTFAHTIETLKKGETVTWISEAEKGFAKIRTSKGNIGYVKQNKLTHYYTVRENMETNLEEEQEEKTITNMKDLKKVKTIQLKNIQTYQARAEMIEKIVDQCVTQGVSCLAYQNETLQKKDEVSYGRFQKELKARLREVGIELK